MLGATGTASPAASMMAEKARPGEELLPPAGAAAPLSPLLFAMVRTRGGIELPFQEARTGLDEPSNRLRYHKNPLWF